MGEVGMRVVRPEPNKGRTQEKGEQKGRAAGELFTSAKVLTWFSGLMRFWRRLSNRVNSSAAMITDHTAPKGRAWALNSDLQIPLPVGYGKKIWT